MDNHKQRVLLLVAIAWLGWGVPAVSAAPAPQHLFEVEMTVPDQLAVSREAVIRPALEEVLVRAAGTSAILQTEQARSLLENPARHLQQYRYFSVPDSQPPVLKLWLRFDADRVRQVLQPQADPAAANERPDILVWLAVDAGDSRYIVSADDDGAVHQQLVQAAQQRGVPVLFPLMDLMDQVRVRFPDISDGLYSKVLDASARYSPQAVLIGLLNRDSSGGWTVRWHMEVAGQSSSWSSSEDSLENLMLLGMGDTAGRFASGSAMPRSGDSMATVNITVNGVNNLAAYAQVSDYFDTLPAVVKARLGRVAGTQVEFILELSGNLQDLNRTVSIGSVLEPLPGGMPGHYRIRQ
ncbi:MAG: DUF2066 domain-containing protein [Gammaproteobacteria bacterium]